MDSALNVAPTPPESDDPNNPPSLVPGYVPSAQFQSERDRRKHAGKVHAEVLEVLKEKNKRIIAHYEEMLGREREAHKAQVARLVALNEELQKRAPGEKAMLDEMDRLRARTASSELLRDEAWAAVHAGIYRRQHMLKALVELLKADDSTTMSDEQYDEVLNGVVYTARTCVTLELAAIRRANEAAPLTEQGTA